MSAADQSLRLFVFDVQAFATVQIHAPNERRARELVNNCFLDDAQGSYPDGCKLVVVSITADDGEPYLMDEEDEG